MPRIFDTRKKQAEIYNFFVIKYSLSDDTLIHFASNPFMDSLGHRTWTCVEKTEGDALLIFMAWHGTKEFVKVHDIHVRLQCTRDGDRV